MATDDDTTSDEPAMRPVGLDVDDPGNPFPRFGLVLVVILAAFIISGIDQRWARVVGLGLTALRPSSPTGRRTSPSRSATS